MRLTEIDAIREELEEPFDNWVFTEVFADTYESTTLLTKHMKRNGYLKKSAS